MEKLPRDKNEFAYLVNGILNEYLQPLTLRQLYYRLVALGLPNRLNNYKLLSTKLSRAREDGLVSWEKITDRTRRVEVRNQWEDVDDYHNWVIKSYGRNLQQGQSKYIEVWCEKAVAIQPLLNKYGIPLVAGGGYRSSSALYEVSKRFKQATILYLGDWDPSGLDMQRDMNERMSKVFGLKIDFQTVLLNYDDIEEYNLAPSFAKSKDSRTPKFVQLYGKNVYELDALPPDVIEVKLQDAIQRNMEMSVYRRELQIEQEDLSKIAKWKQN